MSELENAGPRFPVGGPTTATWREHALARSRELRHVAHWIYATRGPQVGVPEAVASAYDHLDAANEAAKDRKEGTDGKDGRDAKRTHERLGHFGRAKVWIGGAAVERAASNLDAAESELLEAASTNYVRGQLPHLIAHVRAHLASDDQRRVDAEAVAKKAAEGHFDDVARGTIVGAVRAASIESRREITRVRSFRNILYVSALVLSLVAATLVVMGILRPQALPLCFSPGQEVVCPTKVADIAGPAGQTPSVRKADDVVRDTAGTWDIAVVVFVGLIAAAVAAAASLKDIKGTSTPYSLPTALAVLKLPTGALTAFLGLQLMRGEFVPGLSALDSPAQIIAWAIVFGYAQQLLTGLVDKQAQGVLDEVGSSPQPAAKPGDSPAPSGLPQPT